MAITRIRHRVKSAVIVARRNFSRLFHWLRFPGLISWIAASLGTATAFLLPFRVLPAPESPYSTTLYWTAVSVTAFFAAAGIVLRPRLVRFAAFFLFAVAVCILHRERQSATFDSLRDVILSGGTLAVTGTVASAPMPHYENFHFLLKIDSADGIRLRTLHGVTVNCICPFEPPQHGRVAVRGVFTPPGARRNPYEYDDFKAKMAAGVWGTLTASRCEVVFSRRSPVERLSAAFRATALAALRKVKNFDNRALLQASFLGDTEFLSPFIKDTFRKSGIYHLIAISGLNTAMLLTALYFLLRLFPLGRTAPHLICLAALWAYLFFVGTIPSLFRATVMATCIIAALLFEKKNYPMHTLGLAGTVWLTLSPESLFGPGYQLSFAATAGLLALFPVFSRFTPRFDNPALKWATTFLFSSLYISISSFLATAPILLYHFGTISYFGLVANLVAVAAMTVAMWAFFAGLLLQMILPFFSAIPLWVAERFLDIVVWTGGLANHVSWSQMTYAAPAIGAILLFSLFLLGFAVIDHARLGRYCIAAGTVIALAALLGYAHYRSGDTLTAVRFAIPKASCMGIRWPDGRVSLVIAQGNRSLPRLIERHVFPWIRHSGNRVETIVAADDAVSDIEACRTAFPALAKTEIVTFPTIKRMAKRPRPVEEAAEDGAPSRDSLLLCLAPRRGCACRILRRDGGIGVSVAARDTAVLLDLTAPRPALKTEEAYRRDADSPASALIMTIRRKTVSVRRETPEDHPVTAALHDVYSY